MSGGATESFGKQWVPGDIVGVFLDLVDHTISKDHISIIERQLISSFYCFFITIFFYKLSKSNQIQNFDFTFGFVVHRYDVSLLFKT